MRTTVTRLVLALLIAFSWHNAAEAGVLHQHALGKDNAPITVIEYANFTCSHCADFYAKVMPEIEKNYIETGKVRFIFRDFPTDGLGLKASALTHCMPQAQYYPFVKILFNNYTSWIHSPKIEDTLLQYALMAGLAPEKAKACIDDTKLLDALVELRTEGVDKYDISGTPTLIINDGQEKIVGTRSYGEYAATFDKLLAKKK